MKHQYAVLNQTTVLTRLLDPMGLQCADKSLSRALRRTKSV
jgi:hypothetical protein